MNRPLKIAICQLGDATFMNGLKNMRQSVIKYCKKHGYDYIECSKPLDTLPPAYQKPLFLLQHIEKYDYVMWLDADTIIINDSIKLENKINQFPKHNMFYCKDPMFWGLNSGVLIFKNSKFSRQLLTEWWNSRSTAGIFHDKMQGDQGRLILLLADKYGYISLKNKKHISEEEVDEKDMAYANASIRDHAFPASFMNTFPPDITEKDFIIHFMGSNRLIEAEQLVAYLYEKYDTINFPSIWQVFNQLAYNAGKGTFFSSRQIESISNKCVICKK